MEGIAGGNWKDEADAIARRLDAENCRWAKATFRAEGVLDQPGRRSVTEKALKLAMDDVERKLNTRYKLGKGRLLRFFPCIGGDAEKGIYPHIHALIEHPSGVELEEMKLLVRERWNYFLRKRHGFAVDADVWIDEYDPKNDDMVFYYVRAEGRTFSAGSEKVMWECARLSRLCS